MAPEDGPDGATFVVSKATDGVYSPIGQVPLWVTEAKSPNGGKKLNIRQLTGNSVENVSDVKDPFTGYLNAVGLGTKLMIIGPVLEGAGTETPAVYTEVIAMSLECRGYTVR